MPTARKEAAVAELAELMQKSSAVILTDYRGLKVSAINDLRRQLRDVNADYKVSKNTLTSIAAKSIGAEQLEQQLEGPTAIAFSYGDPTATAKVLNDFARTSRILSIRAGMLGQRALTAEDITALANIESREVLLARVVGGLNSPIQGLVSVLNASISSIAYVLQARIDQLGGESAGTA